jgi:hypothetical protein
VGRRYARTADVDPDFFAALGQPVLTGRDFTQRDAASDGAAVLVNATFAERVLGGGNAIGRRLRYVGSGNAEPGRWHEIVGVVEDIGMNESTPGPYAGFYRAVAPGGFVPAHLAVRLAGEPEAFATRLRAIASEVDPSAVIAEPRWLDDVVRGNTLRSA